MGATATYTLDATVAPDASGTIDNTATATVPTGVLDPNAANDAATDSDPVTPPPNEPPVADNQSLGTDEDTELPVTLSASDPDAGALTFVVVGHPTRGVLTGVAPNLTYLPDANQHGADSFTFKANDGVADSNIATVTISVTPVNDVPVAQARTVTTAEGTAVSVTLTASDPDGDPLTWAVSAPPTNGTLGGDAPNLTYMPNADFNGSDGFTFTVTDPAGATASAAVSLTVTAVNDPPLAHPQTRTTTMGTPVALTLIGTDVDGDPLGYAVTAPPGNGTLSGTPPSLVYTPDAAFVGTDSFTFAVADRDGATSSAAVTLIVELGCGGRQATIFVREGRIVGGPRDGQAYAGFLEGTGGDDVIVGTEATDHIAARGGDDSICSGAGNDWLFGEDGRDVLLGEAGRDVLDGGTDDDTLEGGDGDDALFGGLGNGADSLRGGPGRDVLNGWIGVDSLDGGTEFDFCLLGEANTGCESQIP
jgi:VCBS repeat-containing protein